MLLVQYSFIFIISGAGAAVSGWLLVHPFDVIKVRAQLEGRAVSLGSFGKTMIKNEGFKSLYSGLSAAVVRQLTYGNLRLGLYATICEVAFPKGNLTNLQNISVGLVAGGTAAFASNPIEVSLVRMQADGKLPLSQQRNYKNVFHALYRISTTEGVLKLWSGSTPTVTRAMVVNALQVGGYEVSKRSIKNSLSLEEGVTVHILSSLVAGFVYSVATLPIDTAKTRIQTQSGNEYRNIVQTLTRISQKEGVRSLWNGFVPYFSRCGGHTVTMFLFLEQYKKLFDYFYPIVDYL